MTLETAMSCDDETVCVIEELQLFMQEQMIAHLRHEQEGREERSRFALAQVYLCGEMLKVFLQDLDWEDFRETLEDYVYSQTDGYQEAREAGDRVQASVMLARVRCTRRLLLRLHNPARQALLAKTKAVGPSLSLNAIKGHDTVGYFDEAELFSQKYQDIWSFQEGEAPREIDPEHTRLEYEAKRLLKEIKDKLETAESQGRSNTAYFRAQQRACEGLFPYFSEPKDWEKLQDFLRDRIESSCLYYQQVRQAGDHPAAVSILAYLWFFKTLLRRVSSPMRRRDLRRAIKGALIIH